MHSEVFSEVILICLPYFQINVEEPLITPTTQGESSLSNKDEETLINDLGDASILVDSERDNTWYFSAEEDTGTDRRLHF